MDEIVISNEDEAIELLKRLIEGYEIDDVTNIKFESWPRFVIRIQGEDFNGTIPTRIMPTLLDLQREVHRVYCIANYNDDNLRKLTKKDREKLELVVKVDPGSSIFETLLEKPILKTIQDAVSRMPPEQITAITIIFGVLATSLFGWKYWLNTKMREKELDHRVDLSRLEKEKMEILEKGMSKFPSSQMAAEGIGEMRTSLVTKLKAEDNLEIQTGQAVVDTAPPVNITGEQAEKMTYTPREKAVEKMVVDEFFLRAADFSKPDNVRIDLVRISDDYPFKANVPIGVLESEQEEQLKNDSWNRQNVEMSLLVKELHGRYTSAKVISVNRNNKK